MPKKTALKLGVSISSTQCPIFQYCGLLLPFFSLLLSTSPSPGHPLVTLGPGPVDNVWERKGTNIYRVSTMCLSLMSAPSIGALMDPSL